MEKQRTALHRLPDYISPGVQILFVGINPGLRSAQTGHHFAGYSNRFWKLLYESALITEPLTYREDWRLPEWKLGITNIISRPSAGIDVLDPIEYRRGRARLERTLARFQPRLVALLGVTILRMLFRNELYPEVGLTQVRLAQTPVFLLPNPSGRNAHYSYAHMLGAFRSLRATIHVPAATGLAE
jgi:double-stranded uracil-DNA glycosylase